MLPIVRNKFSTSSFGRAFVVTFVFVTLAAGLFWLDFFRGYSADVTVLVVSKSATQTSEDISANMAELTQTLSFYNRVLSDNDLIDDAFDGYAQDARKAAWQTLVTVTKQDGSGVMIVRAHGDDPESVKLLAQQTAQTMFSVAGLYYNVKTDVDMRIVDGPFVSYTLQNPLAYVGTVILTSLALTSIFFFFLRIVPKLFVVRKERKTFPAVDTLRVSANTDESIERHAYPEFHTGDAVPWIDPKKFVPQKPQTLSYESFENREPVVFGSHTIKHASAPSNLPTAADDVDLPVADVETLPFTFEALPEESDIVLPRVDEEAVPPVMPDVVAISESSVAQVPLEPTQEEYKRRLNELLATMEK
jgi:capsular polysaccharide biosynthesis protein